MIYVVGAIGLIGGFAVGQMVLYFLLNNVPSEKLLNDPYFKWKYGTLNWVIAALGSYAMIFMYNTYFGG
jgi:ABC-type antimicrobial peptide transport system permease subunit